MFFASVKVSSLYKWRSAFQSVRCCFSFDACQWVVEKVLVRWRNSAIKKLIEAIPGWIFVLWVLFNFNSWDCALDLGFYLVPYFVSFFFFFLGCAKWRVNWILLRGKSVYFQEYGCILAGFRAKRKNSFFVVLIHWNGFVQIDLNCRFVVKFQYISKQFYILYFPLYSFIGMNLFDFIRIYLESNL